MENQLMSVQQYRQSRVNWTQTFAIFLAATIGCLVALAVMMLIGRYVVKKQIEGMVSELERLPAPPPPANALIDEEEDEDDYEDDLEEEDRDDVYEYVKSIPTNPTTVRASGIPDYSANPTPVRVSGIADNSANTVNPVETPTIETADEQAAPVSQKKTANRSRSTAK